MSEVKTTHKQCNIKQSISWTLTHRIKLFVHFFNYVLFLKCRSHANKIRKGPRFLFLWRSYKILLHLPEITRFVEENNEVFSSYDKTVFESKTFLPVKVLCLPKSMRNRVNAMNFNKKVVTEAIYVKGVVFQNRHCLSFCT